MKLYCEVLFIRTQFSPLVFSNNIHMSVVGSGWSGNDGLLAFTYITKLSPHCKFSETYLIDAKCNTI